MSLDPAEEINKVEARRQYQREYKKKYQKMFTVNIQEYDRIKDYYDEYCELCQKTGFPHVSLTQFLVHFVGNGFLEWRSKCNRT